MTLSDTSPTPVPDSPGPSGPGLTLVLGGTGKTGRRVAQRLADRGLPVRTGSRSGTPPFDWDDPATWGPVLDGAAAVFVCFAPDLAVPGAAGTVEALTRLAVERGVRRVVLLSGRGEPAAQDAERRVLAAAPGATVVRASWFAQNLSEGPMLDDVLAGVLALPVDGVREPFVDLEDVADVAVAALTEDGHEGLVHEVTGPRLLTFAELAAEVARATERPLRHQPVPLAAYAEGLAGAGVPEDVVALLTYLFEEVLDGRNASVTDGVQRALGRPARDVRVFAERTAASGVWG